MKILVIGSGGREHAICYKIASEVKAGTLYANPGNGGIGEIANLINISPDNYQKIASFVKKEKIDLTIVGPEGPLADGIVDIFLKQNLKIFGPTHKAAALESSKIWAKEFMVENGIPTAKFFIAEDFNTAKRIIENIQFPVVIKFDGLAAGKGVGIVTNINEAMFFLEDVFGKKVFSQTNNKVIIEEFLSGKELSYLIITDGESFIPLAPAKDYKKIYENDTGPNTGGMGCYSPVPFCSPEIERLIEKRIVIPTIKGLKKKGIGYCGVLYFGLILNQQNGPMVLEYNVRFGDPETEVILPRMESSLLEIMELTIEGRLRDYSIIWSKKSAVDVVVASKGYPGKYEVGQPVDIKMLPEDVMIFHAGTKKQSDKFITTGGRVLNVVGLGKTLQDAREKAYQGIKSVHFDGMYFRNDIAY